MQALCSSVVRRSALGSARRVAVQAAAWPGPVGSGAARALVHRNPTAIVRLAPELRESRRGVSAVVALPCELVEDRHVTLGVPTAASLEVIERAHQQLVMDSLPEYAFNDDEAEALAARLDLLGCACDALARTAPF